MFENYSQIESKKTDEFDGYEELCHISLYYILDQLQGVFLR